MRRRVRRAPNRRTESDYLTEWAELLSHDDYQLAIGYTDTGPTLDLHCDGVDAPLVRWLLEPTGGGR